MDHAGTICVFKNHLLTLKIQKKLWPWSSRVDKPGTRLAATKIANHPLPPLYCSSKTLELKYYS